MADIWLLKKPRFVLRPKIPTKNLHKWGLGEADRAEIKWGNQYGLGEYFQLQAGIPGATQGPPKSKLNIQMFINISIPARRQPRIGTLIVWAEQRHLDEFCKLSQSPVPFDLGSHLDHGLSRST